jgi:hypothetical protein
LSRITQQIFTISNALVEVVTATCCIKNQPQTASIVASIHAIRTLPLARLTHTALHRRGLPAPQTTFNGCLPHFAGEWLEQDSMRDSKTLHTAANLANAPNMTTLTKAIVPI